MQTSNSHRRHRPQADIGMRPSLRSIADYRAPGLQHNSLPIGRNLLLGLDAGFVDAYCPELCAVMVFLDGRAECCLSCKKHAT